MNNVNKSIHELLSMSKEEYDNLYTETYLRWCLNFANGDTDLQKLIANRSIANYYNSEFEKLQLNFIKSATPIYGRVDLKVIKGFYSSITAQIFMKYPISLFESARKLSIINQN